MLLEITLTNIAAYAFCFLRPEVRTRTIRQVIEKIGRVFPAMA